jgi:hypothetical protein
LIAEIFVKDLMLSGVAQIVWTKATNGKLMVGLEFVDVQYNADKLWRKRKYYRKKQDVSGILINNDIRCDITTVDMSVDGFMVKLTGNAGQLEKGIIVKLILAALNLKAVAKIIWIRKDLDNSEILMGLRYLEVD